MSGLPRRLSVATSPWLLLLVFGELVVLVLVIAARTRKTPESSAAAPDRACA